MSSYYNNFDDEIIKLYDFKINMPRENMKIEKEEEISDEEALKHFELFLKKKKNTEINTKINKIITSLKE
jgi:hypothetical protein